MMLLGVFSIFVCSVVVYPTDATFQHVIGQSDVPLIAAFTTKGTSPSDRLAKRWASIERDFVESRDLIIANVVCSSNRKVCESLGVKFTPAIIAFFGSEARVEYSGPRELDNIREWITRMTEQPVVNISEEPKKGIRESVMFVLSDSDLLQEFEHAALMYKNTTNQFMFCANTSTKGLSAFMGKNFVNAFDSEKDGSVKEFVWSHQFPIGFELTKQNYLEAVKSGRVLVVLLLNPAMSGNGKRLKVFEKVAAEFHDKFAFAQMDAMTYGEFITSLNVETYPSVAFIDDRNERHIVLPFDSERFREDVAGVDNGSIAMTGFGKWWKFSFFAMKCIRKRWPAILVLIILTTILIALIVLLVKIVREDVVDERKTKKLD